MFCGEYTPGYGIFSSRFKKGTKVPVRTLGNRHDVVQPDRSDLEPLKPAEVAGARDRFLGLPAVENHHFCLFHRRQLWGSIRERFSLRGGSSDWLSLRHFDDVELGAISVGTNTIAILPPPNTLVPPGDKYSSPGVYLSGVLIANLVFPSAECCFSPGWGRLSPKRRPTCPASQRSPKAQGPPIPSQQTLSTCPQEAVSNRTSWRLM